MLDAGENDGVHIRGSECDQKILSKKESTGYVYSPNYPFPYVPKVVCRRVPLFEIQKICENANGTY